MKNNLLKCGKYILTILLIFSVLVVSLFGCDYAGVDGFISDSDLKDNGAADVDAFGAVPSLYQYEYNRQGIAAFLHFSISTMTEKEVADGNELPSQFTLDQKIDADGYVKAMKDAGFGRIIITTKHHDGFCIWDSEWTEHDIASTNYPGDVLEDLSVACTKYDMDMGIYMSPWDQNSKYYGNYDAAGNPCDWQQDALNYNDYFVGQLTEILGNDKYGNNGRFVEIWLDPAIYTGAEYQWYDYERWVKTIRELEGKAAGAEDDPLIFGVGGYDTGVHWIGNESGVANEETWSKLNHDENGHSNGGNTNYKGTNVYIGEKYGNLWTVMEADTSITPGWFWGEEKTTPKDLEYLREMYCHSVGHGATLLLNVPLNNQGKLDDAIRTRVEEWSENIQKSFVDNNLAAAKGATIYASDVQSDDIRFKPSNVVDGDDSTYWTATQGTKNSSLLIDFGKEVTFDAITIEEEIYHGQRVEAFTVYYKTAQEEWVEYASGTTIGSKRVILDAPISATQIKIEFQGLTDGGEDATPVISELGVYKVTKAFEIR